MTFKQILRQRAKKSVQTKAINKVGPHQILIAPLFTEKSYKQQEAMNVYAFKVHQDANKNDVKKAVEAMYKIVPVSVNLVSVPFKGRERRSLVRRAYKKAIIRLDKKDKIEVSA